MTNNLQASSLVKIYSKEFNSFIESEKIELSKKAFKSIIVGSWLEIKSKAIKAKYITDRKIVANLYYNGSFLLEIKEIL